MIRYIVLTLALLSAPAFAKTPNQRAADEAEGYMYACSLQRVMPRDDCRALHKEFTADYISALSGDYEDQNNVAFMLEQPDKHMLISNPVQACAWRLLIVESGAAEVDQTDIDRARSTCSYLDDLARKAAIFRAEQLVRQIRTTPTNPP